MHKYLIGMFDDEEPLMAAVSKFKEEGIQIHDAVTPFPVHGLEHIMDVKETRLHTAGFVFGALGTLTALGCIYMMSVVDWPNNFGGKPAFSLPAWIPIGFELTVLFASIGMVVTFYIRNGFSIFTDVEVYDERLTSDRFGIIFNLADYEEGDQQMLTDKLKDMGAVDVTVRETEQYKPNYDEQAA